MKLRLLEPRSQLARVVTAKVYTVINFTASKNNIFSIPAHKSNKISNYAIAKCSTQELAAPIFSDAV
jgi:hypothetical protein